MLSPALSACFGTKEQILAFLHHHDSGLRDRAGEFRDLCAAVLPGLGLCLAVAVGAMALESLERWLLGRAYLESLVLAILAGAVIRTCWAPGPLWKRGMVFSAKTLLEVAVVLLGASVSTAALLSIGPMVLIGVMAIVVVAIAFSFLLGRAMGLTPKMAMLVACGNSICGNSAIAAVAPVIGATGEEVAASIAFTALLGVATVIGLPMIGHILGTSAVPFGVLSGLTVYAVPQVLAAAAPMGPAAVQIGALVKLTRVLMLGPVCFALCLAMQSRRPAAAGGRATLGVAQITKFVPWFILAFFALAVLRALGGIPSVLLPPAAQVSGLCTIVAMAALGLATDLRSVFRAGPKVAATVTLSLLALGAFSLVLIKFAYA